MIEFHIFVIGMLVGHRTFLILKRDFQSQESKYRRCLFLWSLLSILILYFGYVKSQLVLCALLALLPFVLRKWWELVVLRKLNRDARELLSACICGVRAGQSVRASSIQYFEKNPQTRQGLRSLFEMVTKGCALPDWIGRAEVAEILYEVANLINIGAQPLERLLQLRAKLRVLDAFERKTSTAMSPAKVQAVVILFIYLSLVVYQARSQAHIFVTSWFWASILLMSICMAGILFIKRSFSWKICH